MAMMDVDGSSLPADSQAKSDGCASLHSSNESGELALPRWQHNKHIIIIIIIFPRHMQTSTRMPSLEVEPTILVF